MNLENEMRTILIFSIFFVFILTFGSGNTFSYNEPDSILSSEAYSILIKNGRLSDVVITQKFDLENIYASEDALLTRKDIIFKNVIFMGEIIHSGREMPLCLYFNKCTFASISLDSLKWLGSVMFYQCHFEKPINFSNGEFFSDFLCQYSEFINKVKANDCIFNGKVEFQNCQFNGIRTSFSYSVFMKPAFFNDSVFKNSLNMHFIIFQDDVSFLNCRIEDSATFKKVDFRGNAEFRYCEMHNTLFSGFRYITTFNGFADFRGSRIDSALFDFAQFNAQVSFVNSVFGIKGVSFKNTIFDGPITNFHDIICDGPIYLDKTYFKSLTFHWHEIGKYVLKSTPNSNTLLFLYNRLNELGQNDEAKVVYNHLRYKKMKETIENPSTEIFEKMWVLIEFCIWGWPTGYGTKFGKILVISFLCWIIFSIPILLKKGIIVYTPYKHYLSQKENKSVFRRKYEPLYINELPFGALCLLSFNTRFFYTLYFCFSLLFKTKQKSLIYVEHTRIIRRHFYEKYFMFLWFFGSVLLALLGLTLANTSPIINNIIGKIKF